MLKITKKYANPQTNPPISHPAKRWFSAGCSSAAATQPILPIMPTMPTMPIPPIMPISIAISPQAAVVLQPLPPIKKSHFATPFLLISALCPIFLQLSSASHQNLRKIFVFAQNPVLYLQCQKTK